MGIKSIFDGLYVDQLIQTNERGEAVIYPHGLAGRGYLLPPDRMDSMRAKLRNLMLVSLATGLVGAIALVPVLATGGRVPVLTWIAAVAVVSAFAVILYIQRHLADGLQPSATARPSVGIFMRNARMARPLWSLWGEVIIGALVLFACTPDLLTAANAASYTGIAQNVFMLLIGAWLLWDGAIGVMQRRGTRTA
jgi:hypothetical protein